MLLLLLASDYVREYRYNREKRGRGSSAFGFSPNANWTLPL